MPVYRSDRRHVENLTHVAVRSPEEAIALLNRAQKTKRTGATSLNAQSSRSHTIFVIKVVVPSAGGQAAYQRAVEAAAAKAESGSSAAAASSAPELVSRANSAVCPGFKLFSGLTIIDLAGSERLDRSNAEGAAVAEAAHINKSLTTLHRCFDALRKGGKAHVPTRDSKLTDLLMFSFMEGRRSGASSIAMVVCAAPGAKDFSETYNALEYGAKAKDVKQTTNVAGAGLTSNTNYAGNGHRVRAGTAETDVSADVPGEAGGAAVVQQQQARGGRLQRANSKASIATNNSTSTSATGPVRGVKGAPAAAAGGARGKSRGPAGAAAAGKPADATAAAGEPKCRGSSATAAFSKIRLEDEEDAVVEAPAGDAQPVSKAHLPRLSSFREDDNNDGMRSSSNDDDEEEDDMAPDSMALPIASRPFTASSSAAAPSHNTGRISSAGLSLLPAARASSGGSIPEALLLELEERIRGLYQAELEAAVLAKHAEYDAALKQQIAETEAVFREAEAEWAGAKERLAAEVAQLNRQVAVLEERLEDAEDHAAGVEAEVRTPLPSTCLCLSSVLRLRRSNNCVHLRTRLTYMLFPVTLLCLRSLSRSARRWWARWAARSRPWRRSTQPS